MIPHQIYNKIIGTPNRTVILFNIWLIAFMKDALEEHIKIKIAVTLNRLLENSKKSDPIGEKGNIAKSYNQIALNADIRKATVSNTFNAISTPSVVTLILIIEAMGYKLQDFAEIYYSIESSDIKKFRKR